MRTPYRPSPRVLPRLRPLAACLASALFLQTGAIGAAASTPHANLSVHNCDDSGSGSLRDVVASAASGDMIDLSGLACTDIVLTSGAIVIAANVANLNVSGPGRDRLSISGNDRSRVFEHLGMGTLSLSGLTLAHGRSTASGGCVFANGNLVLSDLGVAGCTAGSPEVAGTSGGGIAVLGGATLTDSHFRDNAVDGNLRVRGGALAVGATLSATGSTFSNNRAHSHRVSGGSSLGNIVEGGGIHAFGETTLVDSTISGNTAQSDSYEVFGGGIGVGSDENDAAPASLDISHSVVSDNRVDSGCEVCAPQGGGIAVHGFTRLGHVTLNNNSVRSAGHYGGAGGLRVFDASSAEITASVISGNHADSAGGGLIGPSLGVLSIDGTRISGNTADNVGATDEGGGGILCFACALQMSNSSVSGNVADSNGGGVAILYGDYAPVPTSIINSTISGNSGHEGGGVFLDGSVAHFNNSTVAFNQASSRGAGLSASSYTNRIELQSTIVANNLTGTEANNVWAFPDTTISGAHNLVPNAPGLPAEMPDDTIIDDPQLMPLANNGGPTPTHALGAGSPAIDSGNNATGLLFDQRGEGFLREAGSGVDIGAFERQGADDPDHIFHDGFEG